MKDFIHTHYAAIFAILVLAVISLSFGVGYEQGRKASSPSSGIIFSCPNTILESQKITPQVLGAHTDTSTQEVTTEVPTALTQKGGAYLGSKNGTKYYTPGCPGANRIKATNIIWFQTVEDATLQGYTKGSC
jgi:hypothetical protein